ncbi:MAG: DNA translocase FtsK [Oscillospiraceae bacterium]|jgi:S-DNA-T family DNA segregation ATPase FtsK/SpoIIIE|nr:DNA translocase FtsK [Oscillospiraceae bacterium]
MPTQTTRKTTSTRKKSPPPKRPVRREVGALVCLLFAVLLFFGYGSAGGPVITGPRDGLKWLFGAGFYIIPFSLLLSAFTLGFHRGHPVSLRVTCTLLLPVVLAVIIRGFGGNGGHLSGGLADAISKGTHPAFTVVLFMVLAFVLLFFIFNRVILRVIELYLTREKREYEPQPEPEIRIPSLPAPRRRRPKKSEIDIPLDDKIPPKPDEHLTPYTANMETEADPPRRVRPESDIPLDIPFMEDRKPRPPESAPEAELVSKKPTRRKPSEAPAEPFTAPITSAEPAEGEYVFPPLDLLAPASGQNTADSTEEVRMNTERLEAAFRSFGVNVKISNATRGPSVTRYEAELEAGVKLSRITNLADDIALSLGAHGVRIAPMPGRISTVGIEVPNKNVSAVFLRELIESPEFRNATSKLTFAIGKNISGESIVGDISKLTHMLVAGTTGAGKSVCLNSLILSILYRATPDEVRLMMIDPKMVEFRVYNGIPHLLVPVVTDVKKASGALQWAVVEMEKRFRMLSEVNVSNLAGYNKLMRSRGEPILPQIVVVIDELADLMMSAKKEVEDSIVRVAQKGRAAGMHLVIATQSPRADVITGLMRANIPSKIALKVSSSLESRIIFDSGGADKLVGNGDMLFLPMGTSEPVRIQGAWVTDPEREAIANFIKKSGETQYSEEIMTEIERAAEEKEKSKSDSGTDASDYDELVPAAAEVIFDSQQASTSMLQRRLKLGYARAARIVDQLEQIGLLGPFEGSKPRQILLTRDQWREMQLVQGTAPLEIFALSEEPEYDDEPEEEDDDAPF